MQRRIAPVAILAVVATLTLTSCSTFMNGAVGIKRSGDEAQAVVQMCKGSTAKEVVIMGRENGGWTFDSAVESGTLTMGTIDDISQLVSSKYRHWMEARDGSGFANGPNLTSNDVSQLEDGQILSYDFVKDSDQLVVYDEESFVRMVNDYCKSTGQEPAAPQALRRLAPLWGMVRHAC